MNEDTRARLGLEATRLIREIESALDDTIALHGQLVSFLPQARKDAGLSAVFGQGLFDQVSEVLNDLTQARRRMVSTHRSAEAAGRMIGWMSPPDGTKPDQPIVETLAAPHLRVVTEEERAA